MELYQTHFFIVLHRLQKRKKERKETIYLCLLIVSTIKHNTIRMKSTPIDPPIIAPSLLVWSKTSLNDNINFKMSI